MEPTLSCSSWRAHGVSKVRTVLLAITCSPIGFLLLIIVAFWLMTPHAIGVEFEVEGRIEYSVQPIGQGADSIINHKYVFSVRVTDAGWNIRTRPLPETEKYYESGYDGRFLYEYVFSNNSSTSPSGYNGAGTIEEKDVPTYGGSMACFVWLAYASSESLARATNHLLRPLLRLDDAFLAREGYRVRATWVANSDALGLPRELDMFEDGMLRWSDSAGNRHSEVRAAPFNKGFLCLAYRATAITNMNGLLLPETGECKTFVPMPGGKEHSDVTVSSLVRIYADRFYPKPRNHRVVPALTGITQVDDLRFWTPTGGVPVVRYLLKGITNWPAREDEFVRSLVSEKEMRQSGSARQSPRKGSRWAIFGIFIVTTLAFLFAVRRLSRVSSREDQKK